MNWLISANSKIYDHASSFEHYGFIDWRQGGAKFAAVDIVYVYCTAPVQKVRYKCVIEKANLTFHNIRNDREYWLNESEYQKALNGMFMRLRLVAQKDTGNLNLTELKAHGLKAAPQGPVKVTSELLTFIENQFHEGDEIGFFPETSDTRIDVYEGLKKQVTVNKYERSSIARAKCVEFHGARCCVCDFDFGQAYGSVGEGFIHVHHIQPLHKIGTNYKINYEQDLVPVCPNCHAMLHRKLNGEELSLGELRKQLNRQ